MLTEERLKMPHGFFGRQGGVSTGLYTSLNCGVGSKDDPAAVQENRTRVMDHLSIPLSALNTPHQVHSADCVVVTEPLQDRPRADALATDRPGLALGILTADCAPVLFSGRKADGAPVIAAAHAGWRGALSGVLENTVGQMEGLSAARPSITAVIGPCIGPGSYEVQPDFLAPFLNDDPASARFFLPSGSAWYFDLPAFVLNRLRQAGVQATACGADTFALPDDYFSYRRTTRAGEKDYGRQLSVIAIPG